MRLVPNSGAAAAFRLNSLPEEAFAHPAWACAERLALEWLGRRERVLLLGRPGTGKTLLLRSLERTLRGRGVSVRYFRGGDPIGEAREDVLLIDEAGLLAGTELERIARLRNAVVLAGLPSLPLLLSSSERAFRRVTLEALTPEDVARFVLARLAASGRQRGLFTPEALVALARHSGGLLRLVIILAGAAIFFAEERGAAKVTADDVAEAALMRTVLPDEEDASDPVPESGERVAPAMEPEWLGAVASGRRRWGRPVAIAGLTGWVCASLAVIAVATIAARATGSLPLLTAQAVQGRSAPVLASAGAPEMARAPAPPTAPPAPVQTASTSAPTQAGAVAPQAAEPPPWPEAGRSETKLAALPSALAVSEPTPPVAVEPSITVLAFTGPILNDTMGQGGQLSLQLRTRGAHGPVAAVFHASKGLIGTGVLTGEIGMDGRITLSGRLMMGQNPFDCALQATLKGERLVGAATFVRATSGASAHSSFTLTRL